MASNTGVQAFLTQIASEHQHDSHEILVVQEMPKLDIEIYISNYQGPTRFQRLLYIARSSPPLCVEALRAAVAEAKKGNDVSNYKLAWDYLRTAAPHDPAAVLDEGWISTKQKQNAARSQKLEHELNHYRNNLITESIRMALEDLGEFHESAGNLTAAQEVYQRARTDASTALNSSSSSKHLIRLAILQKDYNGALVVLSKMHPVGDDEMLYHTGFASVIRGLSLLGLGRFDEAARAFLRVDLKALPPDISTILTPNDVAVYGGLLALATMDRSALQKYALDNQCFRAHMSLEPYIRKAISLFVNCRYSACLEMIEPYRADYLLDIHLSPHANHILSLIRTKCIVNYCAPFSCVSLDTLQQQFAADREPLLEELERMIQNRDLPNGKLDKEGGYLENTPPDPHERVMEQGTELCSRIDDHIMDRFRYMASYLAGVETTEPMLDPRPSRPPHQPDPGSSAANGAIR